MRGSRDLQNGEAMTSVTADEQQVSVRHRARRGELRAGRPLDLHRIVLRAYAVVLASITDA